jgi:endoglucanase
MPADGRSGSRRSADAAADKPLTAPGGFYTKGKYIYDNQGKKHIFRGVNRPGYEDKLDGDFRQHKNEFPEMARWGANVVRIPINQHWWLTDKKGYRAKIAQVINWTLENNMTAIADLHRSVANGRVVDMHTADEESLLFWKKFAAKYKDKGRVLFELYNEPKNVSARTWMKGGVEGGKKYVGMQRLYDAIRALGAHNLIVIGGLNWGYDLRGLKTYPLNKGAYNVVYSSHLYHYGGKRVSDWPKCWAWILDKHPVILTEFGYAKEDLQADGSYSLDYERAIFKFADENDVSWVAWAWTSLFRKHTIFVRKIPHIYNPARGVFKPLTKHGQLIKDNLLKHKK